jgi:hypothetical protein
MSGYAPGPADVFAEADGSFADLKGWLAGAGAAGTDHAELEKQVSARGRELLRQVFQAHLDLRAAREERQPAVTGPDQITRTRAEKGHTRTLASVFGPVTVTRIAYRAPGAPNVHPLDEQLDLPAGKYSHGLCEMLARAAARVSIAAACQAVFGQAGVRIGTRQASQVIRRAAAGSAGFYAARRPAPAAAGGQVLVLEADAKGIKMLPGSLRPAAARAAAAAVPRQAGRLSQGEVRTRKRMAEAGAVFDWAPVPRAAAGIIALPGEELPAQQDAAAGRAKNPSGVPEAENKYQTASVAKTTGQVMAGVFAEADCRDPARERTWIALADGNKDQLAHFTAQAAARGIDLPILIDVIHVTEYLWDAAWSFFPPASPDAGTWVRGHARAILDGHAPQVAAAIRDQAAATPALSASKHKIALRTVRYLDKHAPYLDYPRFLASGWPISTGVIEGACRHLIKDRMDITGARWSTDGAEAILSLRVILANDDWDQYWPWHRQHQHRLTYRGHRTCWQLAA